MQLTGKSANILGKDELMQNIVRYESEKALTKSIDKVSRWVEYIESL